MNSSENCNKPLADALAGCNTGDTVADEMVVEDEKLMTESDLGRCLWSCVVSPSWVMVYICDVVANASWRHALEQYKLPY